MPNGGGATGSAGWVIGIIAAVVVVVVIGSAWNYGGYGWGTWWKKNASTHAANTAPNSGGPGAVQPQNRQTQQSQEQLSRTEQPLVQQSEATPQRNQQGQRSNTNGSAQNPSSTNQAAQTPSDNTSQAAQNSNNTGQAAQNPTNTNQAAQNQSNNGQTISPSSLSPDEVRQLQLALNKNGFGAGPTDGRWGPKTSEALKQFQRSKNLQASGQLDQPTLSQLGMNASSLKTLNSAASGQKASKAFARAKASRPAHARRQGVPKP